MKFNTFSKIKTLILNFAIATALLFPAPKPAIAVTIKQNLDRQWTTAETRKYLTHYDRLQKIAFRLNNSMDDTMPSQGSLPFIMSNAFPKTFWKKYGIQPKVKLIIAAI